MSNMAIKYRMKQKMAKGGSVCKGAECPGCEMCHGGEYADGGDVKPQGAVDSFIEGFKNSFGLPAAAKPQEKKPESTNHSEGDRPVPSNHHEGEKKMGFAKGGDVDHDLVDSIMKERMYSKGGQVANDVGEGQDVDAMPNQYDDLVLRDDLEEHYTGANSGDELGNAQEDQDERDLVAAIMKSRKKKDRLPNPR